MLQRLAGPVTGQGGGGADLASALNLDIGVQDYFGDSIDKDCYGSVRLQPLIYIDDVNRSCIDVNSMRAGNEKFASMATGKQLKYHPKNHVFLIFGTENFKARSRLEIQEEPVMLGESKILEKQEEKYLGDILSSEGLSESVQCTVKDREGKVKGSIYELRAIIEDFRMQSVGGIEAAIDLYESCVVPSLLANCATWLDVKQHTVDRLDSTQDLFGCVLLQVPLSSPRLATRAALGLTGMKWRLWEEKVLLLLAIKQQEDDCLAKQVLLEQARMGWPGLAEEVRVICQEIGLQDANQDDVAMNKEDVKSAIKLNHVQAMKVSMKGEKLRILANSDLRARRDYTQLCVEECRMAFRLDTYQFDCRANMPTRYGRDLRCRACGPLAGRQAVPGGAVQEEHDETQEHLEVCRGYADLWDGLGPYSMKTRCRYFMRVKMKKLRQQQEDKQRQQQQKKDERQ